MKLLPKLRLWLYLWLHFVLISSVLTILFVSVLFAFSILHPSESLTKELEQDLRNAASIIGVVIDGGPDGLDKVNYFADELMRQAAEGEAVDAEENGLPARWSAAYWRVRLDGSEGYRTLSAWDGDDEYAVAKELAIRNLSELAGDTGVIQRRLDPGFVAVAVPIIGRDGVYGTTAYGTSLPQLNIITAFNLYRELIPQVLLLFAGIGVFSGGVLTYALGRRISRLRHAADGFLEGRFGVVSIPKGKDEVGLLGAVIEKLDESLPALLENRRRSGMWEERSRVARRLHDTIKQDLFALSLMTEALEKNNCDDEARRILATQIHMGAKGALRTAQDLISAYAADGFDGTELESGIRSELEKWRVAGAFRSYTVAMGELDLKDSAAEACFLIAKEAISNVAKHASSENVSVELRLEAEGAVLRIADDGKGLPHAFQSGFGLLLMRDRAGELGGSLALGPGPQGGTSLEVRFPAAAQGVANVR